MPLDGLRAWLSEVERKLDIRTRIFLILATIAIGAAGASIYLALDTRDNAVSESDVRALQDELEARITAGSAAATPQVSTLEAELKALQAEVRELKGGDSSSEETPEKSGEKKQDEEAPEQQGEGKAGETGTSPDAGTGDSTASEEALKGLVEEAKKQQEGE